jgi:hypothetical protein
MPNNLGLIFDSDEPMDSISAASTRCRIAIGPHSGRRTLTLHDPVFVRSDTPAKILTADRSGFSLKRRRCLPTLAPWQRDRLDHLCRYVTRPAICLEPLTERTDGQIELDATDANPEADPVIVQPMQPLSRRPVG